MSKLSGKIAVVTGATGGLGNVVCRTLLKEGAIVYGLHSGQRFQAGSGPILHERIQYVPVDVTKYPSVHAVFSRIINDSPQIDILCHLAGGVSPKRLIENVTIEEWDSLIQLNCTSVFFAVKEVLPVMKRQQSGRIFTIGARPALLPEGEKSPYAVSKAGVIALTKTVAEEVKEYPDLSIQCIVPGVIDTEANREWGAPEMRTSWIPPERIAETILRFSDGQFSGPRDTIITMY